MKTRGVLLILSIGLFILTIKLETPTPDRVLADDSLTTDKVQTQVESTEVSMQPPMAGRLGEVPVAAGGETSEVRPTQFDNTTRGTY